MKCHFCTIITPNYLPYSQSLYDSLSVLPGNAILHVLVTTYKKDAPPEFFKKDSKINFYFLDDLCHSGWGEKIYRKYYTAYPDGFRWSMKPVFISSLLSKKEIKSIVYCDNDIFFYNDYRFIFTELETSGVLITPHFRNPVADLNEFEARNAHGTYNAGFVGVSRKGLHVMDWWAEACLLVCEKNIWKACTDDQGHLNLMPGLFDEVSILRHRGCNLAYWNIAECKRELCADGNVRINGKWDIIFIHFSDYTAEYIIDGRDALLRPYLRRYQDALLRNGIIQKGCISSSTGIAHLQISRAIELIQNSKAKNVIVYGAGKHTQKILCGPNSWNVQILAVVDDNPALYGKKFWNCPIVAPKDAVEMKPDAVIISSDTIEEELYTRACRYFPKKIVYKIYDKKSKKA